MGTLLTLLSGMAKRENTPFRECIAHAREALHASADVELSREELDKLVLDQKSNLSRVLHAHSDSKKALNELEDSILHLPKDEISILYYIVHNLHKISKENKQILKTLPMVSNLDKHLDEVLARFLKLLDFMGTYSVSQVVNHDLARVLLQRSRHLFQKDKPAFTKALSDFDKALHDHVADKLMQSETDAITAAKVMYDDLVHILASTFALIPSLLKTVKQIIDDEAQLAKKFPQVAKNERWVEEMVEKIKAESMQELDHLRHATLPW